MNKKKLLHIIMSRLGDNWCNSGVGRNEKAYAWTKNKAAADALTEILHDLCCKEFHEENVVNPDYKRDDIFIGESWYASFDEL